MVQLCEICNKELKCPERNKTEGKKLTEHEINLLLDWTLSDIYSLSIGICPSGLKGGGGSGPSSGFAIYLACLMDTWGSIINKKFGIQNGDGNVGIILKLLQDNNRNDYLYTKKEKGDLTNILRNNLVHNYGLKVLFEPDRPELWLNIDINSVGPVIDKRDGRWHIDCWRLRDHFVLLIKDFAANPECYYEKLK